MRRWGFKSPRQPKLMSRKNKRQKKRLISRRLENKIRRIWVSLVRTLKKEKREEQAVYLPGTRSILEFLRERSRDVRANNKKVEEWVGKCINEQILRGEPVTVLTQWCVSKDLEERFREQGGEFVPTKQERRLFEKSIPDIANAFQENGVRLSWIITLNRSYLDSGRIDGGVEKEYLEMLQRLASPLTEEGWLLLLNWEEDVLGGRPEPDVEVLASVEELVPPGALALEIKRQAAWAREDAGLEQTDAEVQKDVYFQIACEAREGAFLDGVDSPFGEFILIPLEAPERYEFFTIKAPEFKRRIVAALPPYPWRV